MIAEDRLVTLLVNPPKKPSNSFSLDYLLGRAKSPETPAKEENAELADERERLRQQLMKGESKTASWRLRSKKLRRRWK